MSNKQNDNENNNQLVVSQRFVKQVEQQFTAEMGSKLQFSDYEKTLAQHLFLKVDASLKEFENKRVSSNSNRSPYTWDNINMSKLAIDAVHRVALGLDAIMPNHIHPVPYFNKKIKKYDLDLRIGYEGKDYYRREMAVDKPVDIVYELVHENDHFKPIKKSFKNEVEDYEFDIINPFDRGEIIGGFGYIIHENPKKNKLVIVTDKDFKKSQKYAQSDTFWKDHPEKMKYKTLVHITLNELKVDPKKVNAKSYAYVEGQDAEGRVYEEIAENANSESIDVDYEEVENEKDWDPGSREDMYDEEYDTAGNPKKDQQESVDEEPDF